MHVRKLSLLFMSILFFSACKRTEETPTCDLKVNDTVDIYTGFSADEVDPWPEYEKYCKFMHDRQFWIADADTLGITHPVDMEIHSYFKVTPFIVPSAISGTSKRGVINYEVDWKPEGEGHYMPDGSISISWLRLEKDELNHYIPGEGFSFDKTAEWDTLFHATFKGQKTVVYCQYMHEVYEGVDWGLIYQTDVFFKRKDYVFHIEVGCEAQPQFLGPESEWWKWLESHWYWLDEPHPDWSRYPIHPDSIKWLDEIPPEEIEAE